MTKKTKRTRTEAKPLHNIEDQKLPFLEHFKELKRRLTIVAVSIGVFGIGAYFIQHQIVNILLKPAAGQHLIYTSPGGGMNFLFQVCGYTGVVFSLPVIIYQILKYFEPLMGRKSMRFALFGSGISAFLAMAGMLFGYFAGLPAVLRFLFHQFSPISEIQPLIAVQSYMSFVTLYMFGAALLFQVPLILIFINRFTRLKPRSLLKNERWFILGTFVLAVLMNPTPNLIDQVMLAGPMILMYQIGIGLVWLINKREIRREALIAEIAATPEPEVAAASVAEPARATSAKSTKPARAAALSRLNRRKRSRQLDTLRAQDAALRAEREARLSDAKLIWQEATAIADRPMSSVAAVANHRSPKIVDATLAQPQPQPLPAITPKPTPVPVTVEAEAAHRAVMDGRPRRYVDGFSRNRTRPQFRP